MMTIDPVDNNALMSATLDSVGTSWDIRSRPRLAKVELPEITVPCPRCGARATIETFVSSAPGQAQITKRLIRCSQAKTISRYGKSTKKTCSHTMETVEQTVPKITEDLKERVAALVTKGIGRAQIAEQAGYSVNSFATFARGSIALDLERVEQAVSHFEQGGEPQMRRAGKYQKLSVEQLVQQLLLYPANTRAEILALADEQAKINERMLRLSGAV